MVENERQKTLGDDAGRIRMCACGQPYLPTAGLYGTTERTECHACTLRKMLRRAESERDAATTRAEAAEADVRFAVMRAEAAERELERVFDTPGEKVAAAAIQRLDRAHATLGRLEKRLRVARQEIAELREAAEKKR